MQMKLKFWNITNANSIVWWSHCVQTLHVCSSLSDHVFLSSTPCCYRLPWSFRRRHCRSRSWSSGLWSSWSWLLDNKKKYIKTGLPSIMIIALFDICAFPPLFYGRRFVQHTSNRRQSRLWLRLLSLQLTRCILFLFCVTLRSSICQFTISIYLNAFVVLNAKLYM